MKVGKLFHRFGTPMLGLAIAGAISLLGSQSASAQGITASTPAFSVASQHSANGTSHYPTGTYQFTLISECECLLSIRNVISGEKRVFMIRPEVNGPLGVRGGVVFDNSAGQLNLKAVYIPGTDMAAELVGDEIARDKENAYELRASTTSRPKKVAIGKRDATGQ